MKKLVICMIALLAVSVAGYAQNGDLFATGTNTGGDNAFRVDSNGKVISANGILNAKETFIDIPTASSSTFANTITKNFVIATLVASGTSYTLAAGDYSDMVFPRTVVAVIQSSNTATITNTSGTGVLTITGVNARGGAVTEVLALSTTTAESYNAFSSITSFTITLSTAIMTGGTSAKVGIGIGTGTGIGLSNDLGLVNGNVYHITDAGTGYTLAAFITAGGLVSSTYDTINFVNAPNGSNDYNVWYKQVSR
jgi:hypothetical protein